MPCYAKYVCMSEYLLSMLCTYEGPLGGLRPLVSLRHDMEHCVGMLAH